MALGAAAIAPAQAASLFSDGFESGTMSAWTTVTAAAGGVVGVQSTTVHGGTKAAQLSESTGSGSLAYARTVLSGDQTDLTATGAFMVTVEGASTANEPIFRFLDATGARAISLYRQNASGNHIWVKVGNGSGALTTGLLPLSTWGVFSLHTIVAGSASTVSVSLNGTNIYTTTAATLTSPMRTVQIGNDTASQLLGILVDDVQIAGGASSGDTTAPDTMITGGPPATSTSASATFTFTSTENGSTFQCSLDGSNYAPCTSPATYTVANGSHTFAVAARDPAGNLDGSAATSTWSVSIPDTTPPVTTILSGPTGTVTTADATFTFTSSEPSTFACKLDGGAFGPCSSPQSYTLLPNG
ncbi:MAG: large repetitive protein, partial [Gaiellaceae bacterium]|nr:large repetitive protein [Gaiellaceae bacterium]